MTQSQTQLSALLEYGTFGRLSVLDADIDEALETANHFIKDASYGAMLSNTDLIKDFQPATASTIYRGRVQLLDYLINIVETIVLADRAVMVSRIGPGHILPGDKSGFWGGPIVSEMDVNIDRVLQYPEKAQALWDRFNTILPLQLTQYDDALLRDVWFMVQRAFLQKTDFIGWGVLKEGGKIDHNAFETAILYDNEAILRREDYDKFLKRLKLALGQNFRQFSDEIAPKIGRLPLEIMRHGMYQSNKDEIATSLQEAQDIVYDFPRFVMKVEAYIYSQASVSNASMVLPTWSLKPSLNSIGKMSTKVVRNNIESLDRAIQEAANSNNIVSIDSQTPQLLRVCTAEADSIWDVFDNAERLRNSQWAIDYRKYLAEILNDQRPMSLIRKTRQLDTFIESKLSDSLPVGTGALSVSLSGSASMNLGSLAQIFAKRKNAGFVFHSKLADAGKQSDLVSSISRIMKMPRNIAALHLSEWAAKNEV